MESFFGCVFEGRGGKAVPLICCLDLICWNFLVTEKNEILKLLDVVLEQNQRYHFFGAPKSLGEEFLLHQWGVLLPFNLK